MSFRGGRKGRISFMGGDGDNVKPISSPHELFPEMVMPIIKEPNEEEKSASLQFVEFRSQVKDGPFFCPKISDEQIAMEEFSSKERLLKAELANKNSNNNSNKKNDYSSVNFIKAAQSKPIYTEGLGDGIKRFTDKYLVKTQESLLAVAATNKSFSDSINNSINKKKKKKKLVSDHPYIIEFFPKTLYKYMNTTSSLSLNPNNVESTGNKRKFIQLSSLDNNFNILNQNQNPSNLSSKLDLLKEKFAGEEDDTTNNNNDLNDNDNNMDDDDDEEDDFDEDEDGDYNAEKYFDDGDDMYDEDGGDDEADF